MHNMHGHLITSEQIMTVEKDTHSSKDHSESPCSLMALAHQIGKFLIETPQTLPRVV